MLLAACGGAEPTTAPMSAPTAEPTEAAPTEAAPAGSLEGKKVCYLIPESGNAFLSGLTEGVKEKFAADGVEVLIYGAEGDAQTQFNQIENCISQGVDGMVIMAALEPDGVASAVLEAKAAGIKKSTRWASGLLSSIFYLMPFDVCRSEVYPSVEDKIGLGIMRRIMVNSPHSFALFEIV
jgi:ABC-type sugar transport system substrate-binding protein